MTTTTTPTTIDQDAALAATVRALSTEFAATVGPETVARLVRESYDALATTATLRNHLPVLAERFARQRLRALRRLEGGAGETGSAPTVLFLCVQNAGRSQMALGFLSALAGESAVGWSGGSEPGGQIDPTAVAVMAERGIDITDEFPKPWTDEVVRAADVVISMGCGDACPVYPGKRYEEWTITDPAGAGIETARAVRDDIESRVRRLLDELGVSVSA